MHITLKHLGKALIGAGAAIGVFLIAKVHAGDPASPAFILWLTAAATLSVTGTIVCVGDHLARRFDAKASQAFWQKLVHEEAGDSHADVRQLGMARTGRKAN
jgi:predicted RecA/RadA family phage recombinase